MPSLWARYVEERLGWKTIEVDGGFITYSLKPPEASVEEFYVRPDLRKTTLAYRLVDKMMEDLRDNSVSTVWAKVYLDSKDPETPLILNLKYGFKLAALINKDIILKYKLED